MLRLRWKRENTHMTTIYKGEKITYWLSPQPVFSRLIYFNNFYYTDIVDCLNSIDLKYNTILDGLFNIDLKHNK